jgi:capsular polysaccharide transport system permease protein
MSAVDSSSPYLGSYGPPDVDADRARMLPALSAQFRVIAALVLRDFRTRIIGHKFGMMSALTEPMMFAVMISIAMTFITKTPPIGNSFLLFYATGMITFNAFRRPSRSIKSASRRYRKCLYLPIVRPVDPFVATMVVEMFLYLSVYFAFFCGYFTIFGDGLPHDWFMTFMPIVVNSFLALGVGMINVSICAYFPPWDKFYSILTMPLMLASGTIHIMDELPSTVRNVLWYNPLAHSVVASRNGFFDVYESSFFDPAYYLGCTAGVLLVGLLAERFARKRILQST